MSTEKSRSDVRVTVSSALDATRDFIEDHPHWLFLLPALLIYLPFLVIPALGVFGLSTFQWSGLGDMSFTGTENFIGALTDSVVRTSLWHNVEIAFWSLILQAGIGLALALAIYRLSDRLRQFFQVVYLLPMTLMAVAVSMIWGYMYNPSYGVLNTVIEEIGINWNPLWLGSKSLALYAIIIVATWQWTGFRVVLWLAGLDSIDKSLLEAARMDGAGPLQRFRYITLPLLKPVAIFITIYTVIGSFNSFVYVWVMTSGGPGHASEVMVTWIYKNAFLQSNFGQAAAISVLLFVIVLVLSLVNMRLGDREAGGVNP
ncbi:carbohydrate ABC transporter permease [Halegenticoccus tardaugens]|uniref:carbohydrate ABC transporter permease n=1 Tax=Halegenticoccus tardaugens TaxID=2071624 RepID=UPI00100B6545|nr:sugar ABC transporter permease [Halegenticoccus tardaugens]